MAEENQQPNVHLALTDGQARNGAEADAARYRWLRGYANSIYFDIFDLDAEVLQNDEASRRLDAAIDARMDLT